MFSLRRQLLDKWILNQCEPQGRSRSKLPRSHHLIDVLKSYEVREFGVIVDFTDSKAVGNWLRYTIETICAWPLASFNTTAAHWLDKKPYRPSVIEYAALHCNHPRVRYVLALKRGLPLFDLGEKQGIGQDIFFALLVAMLSSSIALAAYHAPTVKKAAVDYHKRVLDASRDLTLFGAYAASISHTVRDGVHAITSWSNSINRAASNTAEITDIVLSYIRPVHDFCIGLRDKLVATYHTVFGKLALVTEFVTICCLWVAEHFLDDVVGPVAGLMLHLAKSLLPARYFQAPGLNNMFGAGPQAGASDWLSILLTLAFGVPIAKVNLPAMRNGMSALGWFVEKGWALFSHIAALITGVPYPSTTFETEITDHYAEALDLSNEFDVLSSPAIKAAVVLQLRLTTLTMWHTELYTKRSLLVARLPSCWSPVLAAISTKIMSMTTAVSRSRGMAGVRSVPFWVHMIGEPGDGKSYISTKQILPSVHHALRIRGLVQDEYNEAVHTLIKDQRDPHWDSLHGQVHYYVDDLLSAKDKTVRANTANEFLNLVSPAIYRPLCAEPSKKGNVDFRCRFILSTGNKDIIGKPTDLGMEDPVAFTSRCTLPVRLVTKNREVPLFEILHGRKVVLDKKVMTHLTLPELVTVITHGIVALDNQAESFVPIVPIVAHTVELQGPRGVDVRSVPAPLVIDVREPPGPDDPAPQPNVYPGFFQGGRALQNAWPAQSFMDQFIVGVKNNATNILFGVGLFLEFILAYYATKAIILATKAVYHYFRPPVPEKKEWGTSAYIQEFCLDEDGDLPPFIFPEKQTWDERVMKEREGNSKHDKNLNKAERKQLRRDNHEDHVSRSHKLRGTTYENQETGFYYDPSTGSRRAPRGHENEPHMQGAVSGTRVAELARAVLDNIGTVSVETDGTTMTCFMFGTSGYTWVLPMHMIVPGNAKYTFCRTPGSPGLILTQDDIFGKCKAKLVSMGGHELDAVTIELPDLAKVQDREKMWARTMPSNITALRFYPRLENGSRLVWVSISSRAKFIPGYGYNLGVQEMFNEQGMCGLPIIDLNTGQIIGIHVAGVPSRNESYFACFTRDGFDDRSRTPGVTSLQPGAPVPEIQSLTVRHLAGTGAVGTAIKQHGNHISPKSDLLRSKVDFEKSMGWKCLSAPARLAPFTDEDGNFRKPLFQAWAKLSDVKSYRPYPRTAERVDPLFLPHVPAGIKFRTLTWLEAVYGCDTPYGKIKPIDFTTSVGPFLKTQNKTRRDAFNVDKQTIEPWFLDLLNQVWDLLDKGPTHMWINDNLKDELRDLIRVALGKTRVYYICDLVWLLVQRRLYGVYCIACESRPYESACAVGLQTTSIQWSRLAHRLGLFNKNVKIWAHDRERHDINIRYPCILEFARMLALRVEDVRRSDHAMQSLGHQYHVGQRYVYTVDGINPSGIYMTSFLGSFATVSSFVHYADHIGEAVPPLCAYSDDSVTVWPSSSKADPIEYKDIAERDLNMIITNEDKSPVPTTTSAEAVRFVARNFACRNGMIFAPLPAATIRQMLMWTRGSTPTEIATEMESRCGNALFEAIQHGPDFYGEILHAVKLVCLQYEFNIALSPYDQAYASLLKKHYL